MKTLIASLLITAALASPVAAQETGGSGPANPAVSGSIDAPKTTTSATTPKQQLPGEAQTTVSTEPSQAGPTTVTPATPEAPTAPQTKPRKHHPRTKTAVHGPADEPGAPPPH